MPCKLRPHLKSKSATQAEQVQIHIRFSVLLWVDLNPFWQEIQRKRPSEPSAMPQCLSEDEEHNGYHLPALVNDNTAARLPLLDPLKRFQRAAGVQRSSGISELLDVIQGLW